MEMECVVCSSQQDVFRLIINVAPGRYASPIECGCVNTCGSLIAVCCRHQCLCVRVSASCGWQLKFFCLLARDYKGERKKEHFCLSSFPISTVLLTCILFEQDSVRTGFLPLSHFSLPPSLSPSLSTSHSGFVPC